jgi:hypothetical protein
LQFSPRSAARLGPPAGSRGRAARTGLNGDMSAARASASDARREDVITSMISSGRL